MYIYLFKFTIHSVLNLFFHKKYKKKMKPTLFVLSNERKAEIQPDSPQVSTPTRPPPSHFSGYSCNLQDYKEMKKD